MDAYGRIYLGNKELNSTRGGVAMFQATQAKGINFRKRDRGKRTFSHFFRKGYSLFCCQGASVHVKSREVTFIKKTKKKKKQRGKTITRVRAFP